MRIPVPLLLASMLTALATIVNTLWFVLSDERSDLRIGYYLWLGSFIVLAVTARLVPAAAGSSTAPSTAA